MMAVGFGQAFADDVTYTVSSTSSVTVTGTAPEGATATYSSTYNTVKQLTAGKSMTLTLSGYAGYKITAITLSMKSNSSKGAGYLSVTAGSTTLATIGSPNSGIAFNNAAWNGSYTTSYVDVTPTMSNDSYTISDNEDVTFVIGATINSLYCQSFTITYEAGEGGGDTKKLESIAVKTTPTELTYEEGETFDPTGLVITKTYDNQETEDVEYEGNETLFSFEPSLQTPLTNETEVTITYGGKSVTQDITVNAFVPKADTYTINLNNSLYGVNTGSNADEQSTSKYGITVVSGCKSAAQNKTYYDAGHIRYYADSYLNLTAPDGFVITKVVMTSGGTWNGGITSDPEGYVESDKTWESADGSTNVDFAFTAQNRIASIDVTYKKASILVSLTVSGTPTKTTYEAGEALNPAGLVVTGTFDNQSVAEITDGITWSFDPETLTAGLTSCNVTATVGNVTSEAFEVTGLTVTTPKTLTGITVTGTPAEFWKGDTFNHDGMTVTANYDDETSADVTDEAEFSTPDMSVAGEQTVTVTYKEQIDSYTIDVKTIANTEETAYTTAQAIALIQAGKDLSTEVYVKGVVSSVDNFNSKYYSITYWLDNNTFEVYSGKGIAGADFESEDDIEVGAQVVVKGVIKLYGTTYEFDKNNVLVSYQAPVAQTANMRISAAAWGTFWAPFAVEIPAGGNAYTGEMQEGWIRMNELTEGYIPANTGVVLELVEGEPFETDLSPMDPQPNAAAVSSCYTGNTTGAIMNVSVGDYLLQKQNDVVGWYKVEGEGFTLAPNRCYLSKDDVPAPNQSRSFFGFAPDDATGINSIATEAKTKADGKYIVKGQIVVVKAGKAYNMNGTEVK